MTTHKTLAAGLLIAEVASACGGATPAEAPPSAAPTPAPDPGVGPRNADPGRHQRFGPHLHGHSEGLRPARRRLLFLVRFGAA
jgi:hypothetical protein